MAREELLAPAAPKASPDDAAQRTGESGSLIESCGEFRPGEKNMNGEKSMSKTKNWIKKQESQSKKINIKQLLEVTELQ